MRKWLLALSLLLLLPVLALAQEPPLRGETSGEVRRIDRAAGKVTLRHGPITGPLDMEGMTMVFQVKDPALLDRLKPGDNIHAQVLKADGVFWLLDVQPK